MQVTTIRWPLEETRRRKLAKASHIRLLLVECAAAPPESSDLLEDWIRLPAREEDIQARVRGLKSRARSLTLDPDDPAAATNQPRLEANGILRMGDHWVSLTPIECSLVLAFLAKPSTVISRQALTLLGWPEGGATRNALDVQVLRLRRRIKPLRLSIQTVRSRGYVLEVSKENCQQGVARK